MAQVIPLSERYRLVDRAEEESGPDNAGFFLHIEERSSDALDNEIWIPALTVSRNDKATLPMMALYELVRLARPKAKSNGHHRPVGIRRFDGATGTRTR